jgi:hypothetical protein
LRKIKYQCHYFLDAVEDLHPAIQKIMAKRDVSREWPADRRTAALDGRVEEAAQPTHFSSLRVQVTGLGTRRYLEHATFVEFAGRG